MAEKKRTAAKKPAKKKAIAKKKAVKRVKEVRSAEPSTLAGETFSSTPRGPRKGTGAASAGQSGDLQGLSRAALADSESIEDLVEEGQYFEAGILSGVEDALDPDEGELE